MKLHSEIFATPAEGDPLLSGAALEGNNALVRTGIKHRLRVPRVIATSLTTLCMTVSRRRRIRGDLVEGVKAGVGLIPQRLN